MVSAPPEILQRSQACTEEGWVVPVAVEFNLSIFFQTTKFAIYTGFIPLLWKTPYVSPSCWRNLVSQVVTFLPCSQQNFHCVCRELCDQHLLFIFTWNICMLIYLFWIFNIWERFPPPPSVFPSVIFFYDCLHDSLQHLVWISEGMVDSECDPLVGFLAPHSLFFNLWGLNRGIWTPQRQFSHRRWSRTWLQWGEREQRLLESYSAAWHLWGLSGVETGTCFKKHGVLSSKGIMAKTHSTSSNNSFLMCKMQVRTSAQISQIKVIFSSDYSCNGDVHNFWELFCKPKQKYVLGEERVCLTL